MGLQVYSVPTRRTIWFFQSSGTISSMVAEPTRLLITALVPLVSVMGSDENASRQPQRSSCPATRTRGVTSHAPPAANIDGK